MAFGSRTTPARALAGLAGLVLVLLVAGSLLSSSPSACAACHSRQAEAMKTTPHASVACYGCHLPAGDWSWLAQKGTEWFRMYPRYLVQGAKPTGTTRISRHACVTCHEQVLSRATRSNGLRIAHTSCVPAMSKCDGCHGEVAHAATSEWERRPDMAACLSCHAARGARRTCSTCHVAEVSTSRPSTSTLGAVHGARWEQTHGMGDLRTCSTCHQPIECSSCHGTSLPHAEEFLLTHGRESQDPKAKCSGCHERSFCDGCHGVPMPHPADIRPQHKELAASSSDQRCMRCHRQFDCLNCHDRHAHPSTTRGSIDATLPASRLVP